MGYQEHNKFNRSKDLDLQIMLGTQQANLTGIDKAIVAQIHGTYGKFYKVIDYSQAKEAGLEVIRHLRALPVTKFQADRKRRGVAKPDNTGESAT